MYQSQTTAKAFASGMDLYYIVLGQFTLQRLNTVSVHYLKMGKATQGYTKLVDTPQYTPCSDNLQLFIKLLVSGNMKKKKQVYCLLSQTTTKLSLSQELLLPFVGQSEFPEHVYHSCHYFLNREGTNFLREPVFTAKPVS